MNISRASRRIFKTYCNRLEKTISSAAPGAEEAISYAIPTFKLNGNLVHFAAFKNHIGFYPAPTGLKEFQKDLLPMHREKAPPSFPWINPYLLN
jgi:uncharacterized protein YdhG (YjbR/CyaY superfamily)